jgi:hypothetical protein
MRTVAIAFAFVILGGAAAGAQDASGRISGVSKDATAGNNQRKIAQTADALYLAYVAQEGGVDQVFVARSTDGGRTWVRDAQLSRGGVRASLPAITADRAGSVHAVWVDYETVGHVWYAVRTASGWSDHRKLSPGPNYAGFPAVAEGPDGVHVVWYRIRPGETTRHGATYEILHTRVAAGRWTSPALLSTGFPDSLNPALEAAGEVVQAAWYQFEDQHYRVHHATWRHGRWDLPAILSRGELDAYGVALAAEADGTAHLVWERRERQGPRIVYARVAPGAAKAAEEVVSHDIGEAPTIAVAANGTVHVVWTSGDRVFLRRRDLAWSAIQSLGPGAHPTLFTGSEVWVAWTRVTAATNEVVAGPLPPGADQGSDLGRNWLSWLIFALLVALYLMLRRSLSSRAGTRGTSRRGRVR